MNKEAVPKASRFTVIQEGKCSPHILNDNNEQEKEP